MISQNLSPQSKQLYSDIWLYGGSTRCGNRTIRKLVILFGVLIFLALPAKAATVYVSQSGGSVSCGADGTQSTTAVGSLSWVASNTYKLCGTITQDLVVGADSVSIVFENNASIQVGGTGCGNGCIQLAGHSNGLIDGGTPCGANTPCANNFGDYGLGAKGTGYILQTTVGTPPQSITSITCSGGVATVSGSNPFGYNLPNEPPITISGNSVTAYNTTVTVLSSSNSGNTFTFAANCSGTGTGGQAGVLCPSGSYCSGSGVQTNMIDSQNSGGAGWEIRNLLIGPYFLNVTSWLPNITNPGSSEFNSIYMNGCASPCSWKIHDLTAANAGFAYIPSGAADNGFQFYKNQLNGMTVGLAVAGSSGSGIVLAGMQVHDNVAQDIGLGDLNPTGQPGPSQCQNHTSFLHSWALSGAILTGENIYNNEIKGNGGGCLTGGIFFEGTHGTTNFFGNFIHMTYTQNNNGLVNLNGPGPFYLANNTIIGALASDLCFSVGSPGTAPTITGEDNVITGCDTPLQRKNSPTVTAWDYDDYGCDSTTGVGCGGFGAGSDLLCVYLSSCTYYTFATMNGSLDIDTHGAWNYTNGGTGINTSTGAPASASPGGVAGSNLTSTCTGLGISGNPCLTDIAGNSRPAGSWTVGAYQYTGSSGSVPVPPTNLTAVVN